MPANSQMAHGSPEHAPRRASVAPHENTSWPARQLLTRAQSAPVLHFVSRPTCDERQQLLAARLAERATRRTEQQRALPSAFAGAARSRPLDTSTYEAVTATGCSVAVCSSRCIL